MRADALANRALLLATAQRLFAERGSTTVPYSAIAQAAGVGIGTLYRHFPQPDDLIGAVVDSARQRALAACERCLAQAAENPESAWAAFIDELVEAGVASFLPAVVDDATEVPSTLRRLRTELTAAVAELLDSAKSAQLVPADLDATRFLVGLVVVTRPLPQTTPARVEGLHSWLGQVYRDGLRAQAGTVASVR